MKDQRKVILRYIVTPIASLMAVALVFFGTLEVTSKPAFCSNCHYMEPYVEGWKTSSHADVTCTDCHFPPGFKHKIEGKLTAASMVVNYMTGIYKRSKPWAEISDASCLRSGCHEERLLSGQVYFKEKVRFDHEPHLTKLRRGKQLRCTSCHSQIVQGVHISVTESTCFTCHFKEQTGSSEISECTWCHDAPISQEGSVVPFDHTGVVNNQMDCEKCHGSMQVGDGTVPTERCNSCHAAVHILDFYDDDKFIHQAHVTDHKVECQRCHLTIQHKSIDHSREMISDCSSCHENSHAQQLALFSGTGGHDVPDNPNPMYESGLTCQACHIFHSTSKYSAFEQVSKASYESCDICHGPGYHRILNQWKTTMEGKLETMEALTRTARVELDMLELDNAVYHEQMKALEDAHKNINLVKTGNLIHNVAYSDELLQNSFDHFVAINRNLNLNLDLPTYIKYGDQKIPSECSNCHYGIESVEITVFGREFSHSKHLREGKDHCNRCHTNQVKHGELRLSALEDCNSCHHRVETECSACHSYQAAVYEGTFSAESEPDIMYDEDIACEDCHAGGRMGITRNTIENCIDCHDDSYEDLVYETQTEVRHRLESIQAAVAGIQGDSQEKTAISTSLKQIQMDGSYGAHNPEAVLTWLKETEAGLTGVNPIASSP